MTSVSVDVHEVVEYAKELEGVPSELVRHIVPVVKRAAQNIKTELQNDMRKSRNRGFRAISNHVSYDEPTMPPVITTEIGIDKVGAGKLGNIAVYGTWKGGGTHDTPELHAAKEWPILESELGEKVGELLG